ncbi:MAG TPA: molybdopterin-dependent oxidoreductase [Candidatus Acidoferrum sp.]|nr:molybdopterin-dependent oxidoreductase [Candidatus Acidoferrum sp.]
MSEAKTTIRTTCPRDCYDSCGVLVVKRDGVVAKVLGDPDHPVSRGALCGKCAIAYNGVWRDPNARLLQPLRRTGRKGEGRFEPVSWDMALAAIAERLQGIVAQHGPASIWHTHYTGTCAKIAGGFPMRFFNRLGASEVVPDSICNMAGQVALDYVYGSAVTGFDPRSARDAACLLLWGVNPSASGPHAHKHWFKEARGTKIVVDPVRHGTAEAADLHLQPFPGSDAALAFALLHVIAREGLLDRRFLTEHAIGWDEVEPLLAPCTPAWGERQTGVPARLIEEAARSYGRGPSLLWLGQGLQRQPMGGNVMRACALLPAATGNIGKPGAGFYYLNGSGRKGIRESVITAPRLRREPERSVSQMDLAATLEDPAKARALFCWNINIAASNPQQARLRRALEREDLFTVVVDAFQTDSADLADIVLPAAGFLEFDDLVSGYFHMTLSAQVKAMEPLGESLPNQEIFRRLARAMGYNEPELFESDAAILQRLLDGAGVAGGFAALAQAATIELWPEPLIQFADLKFPTPSGKIEIASARAAADGHPRTPLPLADARPDGGRLRLLSPATSWLMNSSYGNDPKIGEKLGRPTVVLHPDDAAARGIVDGDSVELSNETGRLTMNACVAPMMPAGVALARKSRWPKLTPQRANVNLLYDGRKADMGESTAVHGTEVTIARVG